MQEETCSLYALLPRKRNSGVPVRMGLFVQYNTQKGFVDLKATGVFDEA